MTDDLLGSSEVLPVCPAARNPSTRGRAPSHQLSLDLKTELFSQPRPLPGARATEADSGTGLGHSTRPHSKSSPSEGPLGPPGGVKGQGHGEARAASAWWGAGERVHGPMAGFTRTKQAPEPPMQGTGPERLRQLAPLTPSRALRFLLLLPLTHLLEQTPFRSWNFSPFKPPPTPHVFSLPRPWLSLGAPADSENRGPHISLKGNRRSQMLVPP